jgi:ATP-dependent DNA helicase RecQ
MLKKFKDQSGIIYCTSRKQVEELAEELQDKGYSVLPYHAGLEDATRKKNQELFIKDEVKIIVATIAFGMGINKHNVRFVIHYDLPKSIESYYQEIGRSGRDGLISHCLLLFGYGDISKIKYFINKTENESEKKVAQQHLDAIIRYAEAKKCKRIPLLKYFGEDYKEEKCGMCVNCISEKIEIRDLTIEAQKFLSCVARTGQKFGAGHVIDVLRGSENEKVLSYRHHELSTYNIGKELSKKQWMQVSRQLIEYDFLEVSDEFNVLKLKSKATDLFKKKISFFGVVDEAEKDYEKVRSNEIEFNKFLFDELKKLRLQLADKYKIPASAIFPDRTLLEMASEYPRTKTEMMKIHGMGTVKYAKFGDIFLKKVLEYIKVNKLEVKKDLSVDDYEHIPRKNAKYMLVGEDFKKGLTIEDICKKYSILPRTAIDNCYKYTLFGNKINKSLILINIQVDDNKIDKAMSAFEKYGTLALKPIFDDLNEEVDYDQLALIRLFFMNSKD